MKVSDVRNLLIIDHERLGEVNFPNQKKVVESLKEARVALLEDKYGGLILWSVLEEANEIESFIKNIRNHPALSELVLFSEYALMLALPKELNLIPLEDDLIEDFNEDFDDNELEDTDVDVGTDFESPEGYRGGQTVSGLEALALEKMKNLSAKSLVIIEQELLERGMNNDVFNRYLQILRQELIEVIKEE